MKFDAEGNERCIFGASSIDLLRRFRQIILEVHKWDQPACKSEMLQGVQQLLRAGFVVAHLHGNNYRSMIKLRSGLSLPTTFEVTFVASDTAPVQRTACLEVQDVSPLDAMNRADRDELPP